MKAGGLFLLILLGLSHGIRFTEDPKDVASQDGLIEFRCAAESEEPVKITWLDRRSNKELQPSYTVHIKTSSRGNVTESDLAIVQPERGYIHEIYCQASNQRGSQVSRVAYGSEAFINPIEGGGEDQTKIVYRGESVTLECRLPQANPKPTVEWFKDDVFFLIRPYKAPQLSFVNVEYSHQGSYKCVATNKVGTVANRPISLVVKPPTIPATEYPATVEVRVGEKAKLSCKNYQQKKWRRLDGPIDTNRTEITENYLILNNVQVTDAGTYVCEDPTGQISTQTQLAILSDPEFIITPENQRAQAGSTVLLQCRAKGHPKPSIYWNTPDKNMIFTDNMNKEKYEILPEGHLRIYNVNSQDQGEYECCATSSQNIRSTKATLEVMPGLRDTDYFPPVTTIPAVIRLTPSNVSVFEGESAYFPCEIDYQNNLSKYKISWTKRTLSAGDITVIITSDQRFQIQPNGTLIIREVRYEDIGVYECFVEVTDNMSLKSKWAARLNIAKDRSYPGSQLLAHSPSGLTYQLENPNVILSWKAPSNVPEDDILYRVEYFNENELEAGWQLAVENWTMPEIKVEGLVPENAYYFLIRPWVPSSGKYGWSSQPLGPITPKKVNIEGHDLIKTIQSIEVTDIVSSNIGHNKVRIKWKVQDRYLPYIGGFNMKYREVPLTRCISDIHYKEVAKKERISSDYCSLYNLNREYNNRNNNQKFTEFLEKKLSKFDKAPDTLESITQKVETSTTNPNFEIILGDMKTFSCQEFEIEPFSISSQKYGSIKGRESQSSTLLVREGRPAKPPGSLCVFWENSTSITISWDHLKNEDWNGLPVAYAVYLTDKSSKNGKVIKTEPSQNQIHLPGVKGQGPFIINIAAENCIDSSIRSENVEFHWVSPEHFNEMKWGCSRPTPLTKKPLLTDSIVKIIVIIAGIVLLVVTLLLCTTFFCCFRRKMDKKELMTNLYSGQANYDMNLKPAHDVKGNFHLEPLLNTPMHPQQRAPLPPSYTSTNSTGQMHPSPRQDFGQSNNFEAYPNGNFHPQQQQQQQGNVAYSTYNPMIACNHHTQNYQIEDYGAPYASTLVVADQPDISMMNQQPYQNQYVCHSSSSATGEESLTKGYNSKKTNSTRTPSTSSSNGVLCQKRQGNSRNLFEHMIPPPPNSPPPPCPPSQSNMMLDDYNKNSNYSDLY